MLSVLDSVKSLLKLSSVSIDNFVFKLHYKATVIIFIAFSILVSCTQYLGDPIICTSNKENIQSILNTYCWVHSTYTVSKLLNREDGVAAGGVGHGVEGKDEFIYHTYYQWMVFFLFFEALLFYLPRYIWKLCEEGRVKALTSGLNSITLDKSTEDDGLNKLMQYMNVNLHSFRKYSFSYFGCEIFNFFIAVMNIVLMDAFLGGEFSTYGIDVIDFIYRKPEDRVDPMLKVFPKVTKCYFKNYGTSGGLQNTDALCLLSVNILNEKIVVFLWFWMVLLAIVSGLNVAFRIATILSPKLRYHLLLKRSRISGNFTVGYLSSRLHFGDWFIISLIGKNVNLLFYKEFLERMAGKSSLLDDGNACELKSVESSD